MNRGLARLASGGRACADRTGLIQQYELGLNPEGSEDRAAYGCAGLLLGSRASPGGHTQYPTVDGLELK